MIKLKSYLNLNPKQRIFSCCGAGGTGKTVVLDRMETLLNEKEIPTYRFNSVVRGYYAEKGVENEKALLQLPQNEQEDFQFGLGTFFLQELDKALKENPGKLLISDRSFFDHMAYIVYTCKNLTLQQFRSLEKMAEEYAEKIYLLVEFPYPALFSKDIDPDPFRNAPPQKNLIIAGLASMFVKNQELGEYTVKVYPNDSVNNRCLHIMYNLGE